MLSGELGVFQAFLARWYIVGGYMDVPELVVFMIVQSVRPDDPQWPKHVVVTIVNRIQDSCVLTYPTPSLTEI